MPAKPQGPPPVPGRPALPVAAPPTNQARHPGPPPKSTGVLPPKSNVPAQQQPQPEESLEESVQNGLEQCQEFLADVVSGAELESHKNFLRKLSSDVTSQKVKQTLLNQLSVFFDSSFE